MYWDEKILIIIKSTLDVKVVLETQVNNLLLVLFFCRIKESECLQKKK